MSESGFSYFQKLENLIQISYQKAAQLIYYSVTPLIRLYQVERLINELVEEQVRVLRVSLSWRTFPKKHRLRKVINEAVPLKKRRLYPSSVGTSYVVKNFPFGRETFTPPPVSRFVLQANRLDYSRRSALRRPTQFGRGRFGRYPLSTLMTVSSPHCRQDPCVSFSADVFPPAIPYVSNPSSKIPSAISPSPTTHFLVALLLALPFPEPSNLKS